jgi:DNA-binding response OmpR family regulator
MLEQLHRRDPVLADRDRCIEAGASDYISKPLDIDQLLSLLRVWLYHQEEAQA